MTSELGELGVECHGQAPGFDLNLNGWLGLDSGGGWSSAQVRAALVVKPAGSAEGERFLGKISPRFDERLVTDRIGARRREETARPVAWPPYTKTPEYLSIPIGLIAGNSRYRDVARSPASGG